MKIAFQWYLLESLITKCC